MAERILVGVTTGGPSWAALNWAVHRARAMNAALTLEYVAAEIESGDDAVRDAVEHCTTLGVSAVSRVMHGHAVTTLVRESAEFDLLVVGSHHTGYLHGRVLGTRSVVIAAAASCSVIVVPEDNVALRRGVVVGVALGDRSDGAILEGAREAIRRNEELSLIHSSSSNESEAREALVRAAALASGAAPDTVVRRRFTRRRASEALLDASRTAALLVLGRSAVDRDVPGHIGTVMHEVLLNLNSPVMIAR